MSKISKKDWECLECGRKFTARAAEKAVNGDGCPTCGGCDIDLHVLNFKPEPVTSQEFSDLASAKRLVDAW